MANGNSVAPIIVKKKKASGGDGHHGGAWKVAYADFVTAMMAFFMLMWLLNATTEQQRNGIADYFSPTIPMTRVSGGGDGAFGGQSILQENTFSRSGTGSSGKNPPWVVAETSADSQGENTNDTAQKLIEEVNATLIGNGGESQLKENELRHIVSRISDEGVVIELFDLPNSPLFDHQNRPTSTLNSILGKLAGVINNADNDLALVSHTQSKPVVRADFEPWSVSSQRALAARSRLEFSGVKPNRIARLTGKADTELAVSDPLEARNNRLEIVFLVDQ